MTRRGRSGRVVPQETAEEPVGTPREPLGRAGLTECTGLGHWALVRPAAESHGHLASRGADGGEPL